MALEPGQNVVDLVVMAIMVARQSLTLGVLLEVNRLGSHGVEQVETVPGSLHRHHQVVLAL